MRKVYGLVLVALVCQAGLVFAQERQPAREPAAAASSSDQQLAACLYLCCRNHVEMAKWAQSRLQSDDAKEFAAMMVKDHEPGCKKLEKLAGNLVSPGGAASIAAPREGVRVDVTVGAPPRSLDWIKIHRELADQCLATTKEEFSKKDSKEFDQCYMGYEIMTHLKALDELKVLSKYASPEFRKDLDAATEMATNHLKVAKKIAEQFKDGSERTARKEK